VCPIDFGYGRLISVEDIGGQYEFLKRRGEVFEG